MAVKHSENTACECGSIKFEPLYYLVRHPGQGMTPKLAGYKCELCKEPLDMERQSRISELKRKQHELREIEQELAEIHQESSSS